MIECVEVRCPNCGERIDVGLDPTEGAHTRIEDCAVCCAPMVVTVEIDLSGEFAVGVRRDDE